MEQNAKDTSNFDALSFCTLSNTGTCTGTGDRTMGLDCPHLGTV